MLLLQSQGALLVKMVLVRDNNGFWFRDINKGRTKLIDPDVTLNVDQ
jgi:hypothetical protein